MEDLCAPKRLLSPLCGLEWFVVNQIVVLYTSISKKLALFPLFLRLLYRDYLGYRFRYLYHVIAQGTKAIHLFPKDRMEIDKPNLSPEYPLD